MSLDAFRETVEVLRVNIAETNANAMSITWGSLTIHVTPSGARAACRTELIDLDADDGYDLLAKHVIVEPFVPELESEPSV